MLDADIRNFFDTLSHEWLVKFIEHRIGDRRIVRLIQKWLKAGVLEEGKRIGKKKGRCRAEASARCWPTSIFTTYLTCGFTWRRKQAHGEVTWCALRMMCSRIPVPDEAQKFLGDLKERFARFGLELHPEKTRLIEFGRFAAENRRNRGEGKPETFDFLGFTHICGKTRSGKFTVLRKTIRKKLTAKLKEVRRELASDARTGSRSGGVFDPYS